MTTMKFRELGNKWTSVTAFANWEEKSAMKARYEESYG